jgi:cyclin H
MSYDPTAILKTALFFATKTENHYFNLTKFAAAIGKTTPEDVLAVEFLLTQALRFQFDVRHPFRALEGAIMEMLALVGENAPPLPGAQPIEAPQELGDAGNRIKRAHGKAREVLKSSALLTDAYFHFTPSQIMMASLALADSEVASWYLSTKLSNQPDLLSKIQEAIQQCVNMLSEVSPNAQPTEQEMKELKQLNKKLNRCRDPDRTDLSKLKERAKRDGMGEEDEERQAKKRKMEREKVQKEGDDLFGPSLKR